jgi:hypothetical protein
LSMTVGRITLHSYRKRAIEEQSAIVSFKRNAGALNFKRRLRHDRDLF